MQQVAYPVQFSIDYPDRALDRVSAASHLRGHPDPHRPRPVAGGTWQWSYEEGGGTAVAAGAGGLLLFGPLLMILFRQKYPRWWFDWNLELQRLRNRVGTYLALMDDRYPATTADPR